MGSVRSAMLGCSNHGVLCNWGGLSTETALDLAGQRLNTNHIHIMIPLAITFAVLALLAAIFGFGGIASQFAGIAKILLIIFIILAIVTFIL